MRVKLWIWVVALLTSIVAPVVLLFSSLVPWVLPAGPVPRMVLWRRHRIRRLRANLGGPDHLSFAVLIAGHEWFRGRCARRTLAAGLR